MTEITKKALEDRLAALRAKQREASEQIRGATATLQAIGGAILEIQFWLTSIAPAKELSEVLPQGAVVEAVDLAGSRSQKGES